MPFALLHAMNSTWHSCCVYGDNLVATIVPFLLLGASLLLLIFLLFLHPIFTYWCLRWKTTHKADHIDHLVPSAEPSHSTAVTVEELGSSGAVLDNCVVCLSVMEKEEGEEGEEGEEEEEEEEEEGDGGSDVGSRILPGCGHKFHDRCIGSWLARCPVCPICRARVPVGVESGEQGGSSSRGGQEEVPLFEPYGSRREAMADRTTTSVEELRRSLLLFFC